ncbi:hypothetical protein NYE76_27830 [Paenibacillus sp. FSL M7-0831]|nr:hypothetical protein BK140_11240 [Paenibacillus macerans]
MLADIDGERALRNLNHYIQTKHFFPEISDIVRADLEEQTDYEQQKLETTLLLEQKENWWENATPPPENILKKWGARR